MFALMAKSRSYQPNRHINVVVLDKKIQKLQATIDNLENFQKSLIMSFNYQMDHLANFAKHDMGNAIQNLSANIQLSQDSLSPDSLKAIMDSIHNLEVSLNNLGELIHVNGNATFTVPRLIKDIEIFVRSSLKLDQIRFETEFDRNDETPVSQPFQTLLQLIHNLVINAKKALRDVDRKIIRISANIEDGQVVVKVMDTGHGISDADLPRIFDFGFSTTGGTGIGLFHAMSVCDEIGGDISVSRNVDGFSTIFTLKFPVDGNEKNSCD